MAVLHFLKDKKETKNPFHQVIIHIRNGNEMLRENFINSHKQLILNAAYRVSDDIPMAENSEKYHIGLAAFNYCIDHFDLDGDVDFFCYSEYMIRKWIGDYAQRKMNREDLIDFEIKNCRALGTGFGDADLRDEIVVLKQRLWNFGLTVKHLALSQPKDSIMMRQAMRIAEFITGNQDVAHKFVSSKEIPTDQVIGTCQIQKAEIDKMRDYVVGICVIIGYKLDGIKAYLNYADIENSMGDNRGMVLEISQKEMVILTSSGKFEVIRGISGVSVGQEIRVGKRHRLKERPSGNSKYILPAVSMVVILAMSATILYAVMGTVSKEPDISGTVVLSDKVDTPNMLQSKDSNTGKVKEEVQATKLVENEVSQPHKKVVVSGTQDSPKTKEDVIAKVKQKEEQRTAVAAPSPVMKPRVVQQNQDHQPAKQEPQTESAVKPETDNTSEPTGYPTDKATGTPGVPILSADLYEVAVGGDFTLIMDMKEGNNGTLWILYENGKVIAKRHYIDNSPNGQNGMRLITATNPGTYEYRCELINDYGTTSSSTVVVKVK